MVDTPLHDRSAVRSSADRRDELRRLQHDVFTFWRLRFPPFTAAHRILYTILPSLDRTNRDDLTPRFDCTNPLAIDNSVLHVVRHAHSPVCVAHSGKSSGFDWHLDTRCGCTSQPTALPFKDFLCRVKTCNGQGPYRRCSVHSLFTRFARNLRLKS
jgi:hypothetical protein